MSDHTHSGSGYERFTERFTPSAVRQYCPRRLNAATLGAACFLLAGACVGVTFLNSDFAVQSGATVLGVSLAASGLISLLAGDQ